MNRHAIIYPLVLAMLFALVTFWINQTVLEQGPKIDGSDRHDPDYIISDFVTTKTDASGKVIYVLNATEMKHFPDDDSTELAKPLFTQYRTDKPYTKVKSLRGTVAKDGELVNFYDDVKVTRQATPEKGEMVLTTQTLTVDPNKELVTTDDKVRITQAPKTVVTGEGLIYDKKAETYTLQKNVKVHYERPPAKVEATKKTSTKERKSRKQ